MTDIKEQIEEANDWLENTTWANAYGDKRDGNVMIDRIQATLSAVLKHEDGWRDISDYDYIKLPVVLIQREGKAPLYGSAYCSDCGYGWRLIGTDKRIDQPTKYKPIDQPSLLERIKEEIEDEPV